MRRLTLSLLAGVLGCGPTQPGDPATPSGTSRVDTSRNDATLAEPAPLPEVKAQDEAIEILALLDDPRLFLADPCPDLDAKACYRIGWDLAHPSDSEDPPWDEALPFLLRACELGSAFSCSYLGLLHRFGVMAERDDLTALAFYERSCELYREPLACFNAGNIQLDHDELPEVDKARGLRWYELGCAAGDAASCFNRGAMNFDVDAKRPWYQRACELGDAESCGYLTGRSTSSRGLDKEPSASSGAEALPTPPHVVRMAPDESDIEGEPSYLDNQDSR